jgi:hypothetical protein
VANIPNRPSHTPPHKWWWSWWWWWWSSIRQLMNCNDVMTLSCTTLNFIRLLSRTETFPWAASTPALYLRHYGFKSWPRDSA